MQLIPVLDLMQGKVVRAVRGDRAHYRPIDSRLCESSEPVTVAAVLGKHCACHVLYVADLDALQGGEPQVEVWRALLQADSARELWLDAGLADAAVARAALDALGPDAARVVLVFGSESLRDTGALTDCLRAYPGGVLSLDRRHGVPMDPAGCWGASSLWPERVIMMTLERVGSDAGPDLDTLAALRARAPGVRWYGAGGVRHDADLAQAAAAGAAGWLVASALHDGRLSARQV